MMDLKDLQYFLAVAQAGTITGAAAKLCMAQPPLSRQMKELEEELGTTLFIRGKRHIRLTEEGIFLRQQAEEILSLMEKTRGQLSRMGTGAGGLISIGVTESCGAGVLSDIIERFHSDFPGIRYNIWCGNGDEINDKLDKGLVDLGIVREPFRTEKYESALIKTESWTALLSREHPMAEQPGDTILLSDIAGSPLIIPSRPPLQEEIRGWFHRIEREHTILCTYNTLSCIVPLVERNVAVAICPEAVRYFTDQQRLVCRRLTEPEHVSRLLLVRRRNQLMPAAAGCFWDFARDYCGS